jgi:N-acetylglutamate synthase/N-acetylornithine aminotransferase
MIHPNMATMLVFLTTDAAISAPMLQKALSGDIQNTFNMLSIDGDTSTNDMVTVLANGMQYASYVNDGHRMDKHFVPGLTVADGMLQKTPADTGIMVGTKTTYVPGIHMKEKAIGKYRTTVRAELDKRVREAFK